jgi:hypothetical protein
MKCSTTEASAIQQDARARLAAGIEINRNSYNWYRNALARWNDAAADLSEHLTIHKTRLTVPPESRN